MNAYLYINKIKFIYLYIKKFFPKYELEFLPRQRIAQLCSLCLLLP